MPSHRTSNGRSVVAGRRLDTLSRRELWVPVKSVSSDGLEKRLTLEDGRRVLVHRFACVGTGDHVKQAADGSVWVRTETDRIPVAPPFQFTDSMSVAPGVRVQVGTRELTAQHEFDAYRALSQFHYRNDEGFGRRAILLMTTSDPRFPTELGFIEVTSAFLHLKNRSELLDAPFSEPRMKVQWSTWDMKTRRRLTNIIARISRMVVHPEVRGLGRGARSSRSARARAPG